MTPMEEMRANAKAERAAQWARNETAMEVLEMLLDTMPDGIPKRNGQIMLVTGRIRRCIDAFECMAAKINGKCFDEKRSQQALDYLTCVHVGMTEFMKQIGLEDSYGTP